MRSIRRAYTSEPAREICSIRATPATVGKYSPITCLRSFRSRWATPKPLSARAESKTATSASHTVILKIYAIRSGSDWEWSGRLLRGGSGGPVRSENRHRGKGSQAGRDLSSCRLHTDESTAPHCGCLGSFRASRRRGDRLRQSAPGVRQGARPQKQDRLEARKRRRISDEEEQGRLGEGLRDLETARGKRADSGGSEGRGRGGA